jgi:hypothetical protein
VNILVGILAMLNGPPPADIAPSNPTEVVVALRQTESADMTLLKAMPITAGNMTYAAMYRMSDEMADMPMAMSPFSIYGMPSPKGYAMPKTEGKPVLVTIGLTDQLERYAVVLGKVGSGKERFNRLWVDWNRDRKFDDSEMLEPEMMEHGKSPGEVQCFGPVDVPAGSNRPSRICFILDSVGILRTLPKDVRTGEMELDGKAYKVVLVDANLDGRYDANSFGDAVMIDLNRDGKFTEINSMSALAMMARGGEPTEAMPLQSYLQLPDGAFYKAEPAQDGSSLTFRRDPDKEATIIGLGPNSTVNLIYEGAVLQARPMGSALKLPAGTYRLMGATVAASSGKGKPWTFSVNDFRARAKLTLAPKEEKKLDYGLPLKLAVVTQKYGKNYNISVDLKDRSNAEIGDVRKPDGNYPAEPVLTMADKNGKVIKTQKFHYG